MVFMQDKNLHNPSLRQEAGDYSWDDNLGSSQKDFTSLEDFKKFLKEHSVIANRL